MSLATISAAELVRDGTRFDAVIDARSPSEFALDHLPAALNWPVLDDAQRRTVGTLYTQVSTLQARKVGAVLVARNIAEHIERRLSDKPREWQPLVYCWRGGQRSGALAWYLGQIGFRTTQLAGGYKAWRAIVREQLTTLPRQFEYQVLCGRTGSGKTRLLHALAAHGAQVLDLEALARHRGSVLGALPNQPQPSQKHFDSLLWHTLRRFDATRPVFIESESRKVGALRVPEALIEHMRSAGRCLNVRMDDAARVTLLLRDYAHLTTDAPAFNRLLDGLIELRGRAKVEAWQQQARAGRWAEVFSALMSSHYDPLYERSLRRGFAGFDQAPAVELGDGGPAALMAAARQLLADAGRAARTDPPRTTAAAS